MSRTRAIAAVCTFALNACGVIERDLEERTEASSPSGEAATPAATRLETVPEQVADDVGVAASTEASALVEGAPSSERNGSQPGDGLRGRSPNERGRIPILEYHLIGDQDARWQRAHTRFRRDLELLHERGYRPITVAELIDGKIDLPAGLSPVVFTFDDASPGQFRYIERDGRLEIDPTSAVGIWLDFHEQHPDWGNKAVFCTLSGAEAGRSFFGDKGIEGQKTEWRLKKVRFLIEQGFELCNHTLWHANLAKYGDAMVQEQIARGALAIDSAVAGYNVRTFALPLGEWPTNLELARMGEWTDPKTGRTVRYRNDAILMVAGGPARSPHDPEFDPLRLPRVQVYADELEKTLDDLDRGARRYVSAGKPEPATRPAGR